MFSPDLPTTGAPEITVGAVRISQPCDALFGALAVAQAELSDPLKDSVARVETRSGGSYSYAYVDLAGALRHARPILARHGLAVTQWPAVNDGRLRMTTLISHASGQWITGDLEVTIPPAERMNPVQAIGSVISYARRYAYLAATGLAADDDDGSAGAAPTARREAAPDPKPKPQAPSRSTPTPTKGPQAPDPAPPPKPLSAAQHRRLEAQLKEADIPRERVKAWLARRDQRAYPTADDVHLDRLTSAEAAAVEERIPEFRRQIAHEVELARQEAEAKERLLQEALDQACDEFGWAGDLRELERIAATLEERASAAAERAEYMDGSIDPEEVAGARRLRDRAQALRGHLTERRAAA
jgi:hypothetical protein